MLAITATDALSLVDQATLKRAPSSLPSCLSLLACPTASSWSVDNTSIFISSPHVIHKYDPSSNALKDMHSIQGPDTISHLVTKDKSSIIFNEAHKVHILECGSTSPTKISQTFESHKAPITSLSLSNDSTLLASTSAGAAHVHNLTLGSHTVLRGLALAGQSITTSAFHSHSRTRLLLGIGKQVVVYDTSRPSGPIKTIPMSDANSGEISAIACSPFSKTLVALATTGGYVGLIDLDKEKSLFRTLNLKVPLTAIAFSPEGAAIYLGTENGKLLVTDLRALDKPPKMIVISEGGARIETMSIQKKIKGGAEPSSKPTTASATVDPTTTRSDATTRAVPRSSSNASAPAGRAMSKLTGQVAPSPGRARAGVNNARPGSGPPSAVTSPVARRMASTLSKSSVVASPRAGAGAGVTEGKAKKTVFSPVRDPLGNSGSVGDGDISVQIESLTAMRGGIKKESMASKATAKSPDTGAKGKERMPQARLDASSKTRADPMASISAPGIRANRKNKESTGVDPEVPRRARTLSSTSRTRKSSTTESGSAPAAARLAVPEGPVLHGQKGRTRTVSSASRSDSESVSAATRVVSSSSVSLRSGSPVSRPGSSASRPGSSISRVGGSPVPPVPPLPSRYQPTEIGGGIESRSQTPSPELPDMDTDPLTPVPADKKRVSARMDAGVLGLGTPEIDRWIEAGKGKGRNGKNKGKGKTVGFKEQKDDTEKSEAENGGGDDEIRREMETETERFPDMAMQISPRRPVNSWAPSPLRKNVPPSPGGSAHDLLRTIVQDVMYDFRRETKAEMTGLHLDLVRMGRGWKKELRGLMEEYVGDLRDLREENRVLREENERLRRGY